MSHTNLRAVFAFFVVIFGCLAPAAWAQSTVSGAVSPSTVGVNGPTTLTVTLSNATGAPDTNATLNYTLPAQVQMNGPVSTSCVTGTALATGPTGFAFSATGIAAFESCQITVPLRALSAGNVTFANLSYASDAGASTGSIPDLTVSATSPSLTHSFSPDTVVFGGSSTLTYTLDSPGAGFTTFLNISDTLPAGIEIDPAVTPVSSCTPATVSLTVSTTGNTVSAALAPGVFQNGAFDCTLAVGVTGAGVGTQTNQIETAAVQGVDVSGDFASLAVTAPPADAPLLTTRFLTNPYDGSGTVDMEHTVLNRARDFGLNDIGFTVDLDPAGAPVLAFDSVVSDTCGATVGAGPATQLNVSGGSIPTSGASCVIVVRHTVTGGGSGTFDYATSTVTGTVDGSPVTGNAATAQFIVPAVSLPAFAFRVADAATAGADVTDVAPGDTVFAEFTVTNSDATFGLTDGTFTLPLDSLPGTISTLPAAGACGGGSFFFTNNIGGVDTFQAQGMTLAAGASCTFAAGLAIDPAAPGSTVSLTTSALSANVNAEPVTASGQSDGFTVSGGQSLSASQAFGAPVMAGAATTLTTTLVAGAENTVTLAGLALTQDFTSAPGFAVTGVQSNSCGGAVTNNGTDIALAGGSLTPGASCDIVLNVTAPGTASPGDSFAFSTSDISSTNGLTFAGTSSTLSIAQALDFDMEVIGDPVLPGDTMTLRFTVDNPGAVGATGGFFTLNMADAIPGLAAVAPLPTNPCGAGSTATGTTFLIVIGMVVDAGTSCSFDVTVLVPVSATSGTFALSTSNATFTVGGPVTIDPATTTFAVDAAGFTVDKSFAQATVNAGDTVDMTLEFTKNAGVDAVTAIAIDDDLDAFVPGATLVTTLPGTCGFASAVVGTQTVALTGGTIASAAASCTTGLRIQIPAGADGTFGNTTTGATGTVNGLSVTADPGVASLTVLPATAPTFAKSLAPASVAAGGTTVVSYTIDNPGTGASLARLGFSDPIGTAIPGATLSGFTGTCGAGSSVGGTSTLTLVNGVLAPGESCTFSATVTVPVLAAGDFVSATSVLADNGVTVADAAAATLTVVAPPPVVTVAVAPPSVPQGVAASVTYTFDNTGSGDAATGLSFAQTFGSGIVSAASGQSNSCGGALTVTAAGAALTGGTAPVGGTCAIAFDVLSALPGALTSGVPVVSSVAGASTAPAFALTVTPAPVPPFAQGFAPATVDQGAISRLTFTIDNSGAAVDATAANFSNTLPSGLEVATPSNAATTCTGGTLGAVAGSQTISLSGATAPAGASCTVAVDVLATDGGTFVNTSGALGSSLGNSGTSAATLTVTPATPPAIAKSFASALIEEGTDVVVQLQIDNSASTILDATALDITDTLPAGLVVSDTPNAGTTCTGGTLTAVAGAGAVTYTGGTVSRGGSCTVNFTVTAVASGSLVNTTGDLTSSLGNSGTASATLGVLRPQPPTGAIAFDPATVAQGVPSTYTATVTSVSAALTQTGVGLTQPFPAGVTIADPPAASTTCTNGTVSATAGGSELVLTGGVLDAGATCTVSVDVVSTDIAVYPVTLLSVGTLESARANSATATLTVVAAPAPVVTGAFAPGNFVQGASSTLTYTFDNTAAAIAAAITGFTDTLPTDLIVATPTGAASTCGGTITAAGSNFSLSGGSIPAGGTCTVQVDVTSTVAGLYNNVLDSFDTPTGVQTNVGAAAVTVDPAPVPTVALAVAPATVEQGGETRLTATIGNVAALVPAETLSVDLLLPAGVALSTTPDAATDCGAGAIVPIPGGARLTADSLAAGATCTAAVDLIGLDVGGQTITAENIASTLGNSLNAATVLTVTAADLPVFTKSFDPASVVQGGVSRLTFAIDNSGALVPAAGGSFTDTFPANLQVAPTADFQSSCVNGASVPGSQTVTAGSVAISGITVAAGDTCTYAINVQPLTPGDKANETTALITTLGDSGTAAAVLGVTAAPVPTFSAGFAPNTVAQGGTSTLTVTLDNSGGLLDATGAAFDVPLPTDMVVATPSNAATDCGPGILTATVGAATADLAGGTIPAGGTCSVSFDVTSVSADAAQTVTTGALTTSLGDVTTGAAATLNVTAAPLPILTKLFAPATITQGEVTTVTYTIDNSAALVPADAIVFSESFAGGVVLADPPNGTDTCGGTSTGTAGAGSFAYVGGGTVAAGDTCEVAFNVTSVEVGSPTLTSDDLVTSLGNSGTAAASLTVQAAPVPLVSVSFDDVTIVQGGVSTLRIGIENVAAISATAINFTNTMPDGMIPDLATRNPTNGCNGTLNVSGGSEVFTLVGGSLDPFASCEITVPIQATQGGIQTNTLVVSSSLGDSTPAPASIDVTAAPAPTATALFVPDTIVQGDVSTFTVSIDNAGALVSADTLDVTVPLPAGLVVAPTANAASTCAAPTFAATPGDSSFALTGGEVAAGGTCDFAVDVRGTVDDAYTVTTGALTSSLGDGGTATASLTVTPADTPLFSVALSPATITQGLTSTAIYTIDNSAPLIDATTAGFVGQVQSGLEIAAVPNASTTCTAGAVQITGPGTFDFADGTILAGETCTVSVDVTGTTVGTFDVAGGPLITSQGTSGNTVASLTVNDAPAPGFGSRYAPPSIPQGGTTRLILTVDNSAGAGAGPGAGRSPRPAAGIPASNLGFNVNLPAGLSLTDTPGLTNSCGGSATAPANGTSVTLTDGSVAALSTCTVEANVTSMTQGAVPAISGALSSSLGGAALAPPSEPLVVTENLQGTVTFVQNTDTDGNFGFSSSEAALNFTIATVGGSGIFGPVSVDAGTYTVTQSRPAGLGNTSLTCSDDDSTVDVAAGIVTLNIAELEDVTCTFGSIGSQQETTDQINSFLNRRNNLILSNGPSSGRRMDRLNQGIGRSQTLSFQQGDLASMTPFSFDLLSLGSGSYKFSTSSTQIQRSSRMFRLAMDDVEGNSQVWTPPRWDVWFEASFTKYEASQGSDGHFGIAYLGADYLLSADLLVGALVQVDSLDDGNDGTGATIEGTGWMFGPYMTARIGDNLIFDGRLAYGQSDNTISPFGTYADDFDSDRILIDASLSGNYDWNNWVVTPNLAISYIEDRQRSYVDSLGVTIPEQTVSLGQIRVGPTFSTTLDGQNGSVIRPSFTLNGIYNFSDTDGVVIVNDTSGETDGFRARIEAGVEIAGRNGARFQFSANYDGIGQSDFESYGARFQLSIPLQ